MKRRGAKFCQCAPTFFNLLRLPPPTSTLLLAAFATTVCRSHGDEELELDDDDGVVAIRKRSRETVFHERLHCTRFSNTIALQ
jgi:hypothetical protein